MTRRRRDAENPRIVTIADRAPVARLLGRGVLQLPLGLLLGVLAPFGLYQVLTQPAESQAAQDAWPGLIFALLFFGPLVVYGGRNLVRLALNAAVAVDERGVHLRMPVVPFPLAPYMVIRERLVPWPDVDLRFTPGRRSRYYVAGALPDSEIPSGQFALTLHEIDTAIRAEAESYDLGNPVLRPTHVFAASPPAALLVAGAALVLVCGGIAVARPVWVAVMFWGVLLGLGLVGMGLAPRKRVIVDQRGLFAERGTRVDFVPMADLHGGHADFNSYLFGAFKSWQLETSVQGKRVRVGFNQVVGLGFAIDEIRSAFGA